MFLYFVCSSRKSDRAGHKSVGHQLTEQCQKFLFQWHDSRIFYFSCFQSMTGRSQRSVGCTSWTKVTWPLKKLTWPLCWPPPPLTTSPVRVVPVKAGSPSMLVSPVMWPPLGKLSILRMLILTQGRTHVMSQIKCQSSPFYLILNSIYYVTSLSYIYLA